MPWILLFLFTHNVQAASPAKQNVAAFLRELSRLEEILQSHPECSAYRDDAKPSCAKLSDTYCATLWSADHRGNMKAHDGEIQMGYSEKSDFNYRKLMDLQALVNCGERLPSDLAKHLKPVLVKLKSALAMEADMPSWYRLISMYQEDVKNALADTADERAKLRYPPPKNGAKRSTEEKVRVKMITNEVADQLLEAKYAKDPHWKRVEETFAEVKAAMLEMTEQLPFPPELRAAYRKKLASVTLSLPYTNPAKVGAEESCATTQDNAAYDPDLNVFYVCAGKFNAMASKSALMRTIAHELGHSIDLDSENARLAAGLPVHKALQPLSGAKGKAIPCDQWQSLLKEITSANPKVDQPHNRQHPLDGLAKCFADRSDLLPYTLDAVKAAASRKTAERFGAYADADLLINLGQPNFSRYGKLQINDKFMRPDLVIADDVGFIQEVKVQRDARVAELLAQSLACQEEEVDGKKVPYEKIQDEAVRAKVFRRGIDEAKIAFAGQTLETFLNCGETCPGLVSSGLATAVGENMADWYAFRTVSYLLAKKKDLAERREAAFLSTATFCDEPGVTSEAPAMALAQKSVSQEVHPDNRVRRISLFTKENAELLGCKIEDGEAGFSQCTP